jgi:peptidoglycan/LPS O-acetylase OafA/YrhL
MRVSGGMKAWKKYAVLNLSLLAGFVVAIFILPPNTHFWPVAGLFSIFLGGTNFALFCKLQQRQPSHAKATNYAVGIAVLILVLLDLLFQRFVP